METKRTKVKKITLCDGVTLETWEEEEQDKIIKIEGECFTEGPEGYIVFTKSELRQLIKHLKKNGK